MLLVYNIGTTVFVQFDKIIEDGEVAIYDFQKKYILSKPFSNTNIVKISNNIIHGKLLLQILFDGERESKTLEMF